jgi:hypothetical protein
MIKPTQDKKLKEYMNIIAKRICKNNIGIGCPHNYDCEKHACCILETNDIINVLELQGYHK